VAIAEAIFRRYPANRALTWLPAPWLASLVLLSPLTSSTLPPFSITPLLNGHQTQRYELSTTAFALPQYSSIGRSLATFGGSLFPEYLPETTNAHGQQIEYVAIVYTNLVKDGHATQPLTPARCSVVEPARTPIESLNIELNVKCNRPTKLALPITYNAYTGITAVSSDERRRSVPYFHLQTDPRIIIDVPSAQEETLQVSLPTIWRVLF
jgi:hypothetical protein